ncbi:TetR/AcrR family transcriptional regulator [uncultured Amnibacterium sp.]|uniref:TetR/AcrR family transcriptional regulator n=1 Tax=uncultured Amnibacterium sp. TaxID=1631851 RepID=UPI0035CC5BA8
MAAPHHVVRQPKQARSRDGWERALEVGLALIEEGGVEALTVTEVCRRSGINAPSLYARVDGRAGLFTAVWERGMTDVRATEERVLAGLPRADADPAERAASAASAIAEVFATHVRFLRAVIGRSESDPVLLEHGAEESRRLLAGVAAALQTDPEVAREAAQTLYAECVLRTIYGADFFTGAAESDDAFRARLARSVAARIESAPR